MHILLTPYWACGLLGGQKPRSFPETRALSPATCGLGVPLGAPGAGVRAPPAPRPPRAGPSAAGPEPTDPRIARAQTPADPVLLTDTLLSGKAGLCGRRRLPSAVMPERGQSLRSPQDSKRPSPGGGLGPESGLGLLVSRPEGQRGLRTTFCSTPRCGGRGILGCRGSNWEAEAFIYYFLVQNFSVATLRFFARCLFFKRKNQ